jgi:hypothetical protein
MNRSILARYDISRLSWRARLVRAMVEFQMEPGRRASGRSILRASRSQEQRRGRRDVVPASILNPVFRFFNASGFTGRPVRSSCVLLLIIGASGCAPTPRAGKHLGGSVCQKNGSNYLDRGGVVAPGKYNLTLQSVSEGRARRSATAFLWLRPTSVEDRSPVTGKAPIRVDTAENYLYGATELKPEQLGAEMYFDASLTGSGIPLNSSDPVRPGILAKRRVEDSGTALWLGTSWNARDAPGGLDGPGIVLSVEGSGAVGYWGSWRGVGALRGPSGYFCLTRARD